MMLVSGVILDFVNAESPNVTISVTGSGTSIDEAKLDAIRQALQQTMKQLVIVDRAISGNAILRDKVMSTMNGYIEKFQQKNIRRADNGYLIDADITVSASRIENFIGVTVGSGGAIEGTGLLAEQNRRQAQIYAEQLQAKARGEIFDRLFRGFPADVVDIKVRGMRLAASNLNTLEIDIEYSYKPAFIAALESTVKALALVKCTGAGGMRNEPGGMAEVWKTTRLAGLTAGCQRDKPMTLFYSSAPEHSAVCLGFSSKIDCYALPPGDYCASCRLGSEFSLGWSPPYIDYNTVPSLVVFGRFTTGHFLTSK